MSELKPWSPERRNEMKTRIDQAAKSVAEMIGADGCVIVAFFGDQEFFHMQDGGIAPMPFDELYRRLLSAWEMMKASGGQDVTIS